MNKRKLKLDKHGISSKRYKELCGFCEQYPDWKKEIAKAESSVLEGVQYSDMPKSPNMGTSDTTGNIATKLAEYKSKCELIEKVAKEADAEYWEAIIKSICYEVPINFLIGYEHMPISQASFYDRRRYFFYLLDKEKKW